MAGSWPPNAQAGQIYILDPRVDQAFSVADLYLPDDFTIQLPPDWPVNGSQCATLNWIATQNFVFGKGCLIDLTPTALIRSQPKSSNGSAGGAGINGGDGAPGARGIDGLSAPELFIETPQIGTGGSLVIKTYGGNARTGWQKR